MGSFEMHTTSHLHCRHQAMVQPCSSSPGTREILLTRKFQHHLLNTALRAQMLFCPVRIAEAVRACCQRLGDRTDSLRFREQRPRDWGYRLRRVDALEPDGAIARLIRGLRELKETEATPVDEIMRVEGASKHTQEESITTFDELSHFGQLSQFTVEMSQTCRSRG